MYILEFLITAGINELLERIPDGFIYFGVQQEFNIIEESKCGRTEYWLSESYQPRGTRRKGWQNVLDAIESILWRYPDEIEAMEEYESVAMCNRWVFMLKGVEKLTDSLGKCGYTL
ncbi:hypothetical protein DRW41_15635 [Neobacillus piezotolerans]|uniref:Uncharacterized protein n=1 Tax=Neobacillus piezotolerans TaxID=2259171 RepID=A0A3D8GPB8_9BACI|nr:hypothetical protein [Neobacillus piezotolerans]RDU36019.1 hypothetical protein DRW41_15635 [Neobacillus piezotolerans]